VPCRYYQPEADRFLEVVRLAGADGPAEYPTLAVFDTEWDAAAALLPGIGPWVALHAGAACSPTWRLGRCFRRPPTSLSSRAGRG
jgi:hypothetical protein